MAFYRSELEVPVNKVVSKLRSNIDITDTTKNSSTLMSSILDNWCEKVKFQLHNDHHPISNIIDDLLPNDSIATSTFDNKDVNCFSPVKMFQQLQSKIAQGSDGDMHFTARFDVKDINTDDIKVLVKEGSLIISVEQEEIHSPKMTASREYSRKFNLPPKIVIDSIKCTLSSDGILCLDGVLESSFDSSSNRRTSASSLCDSQRTLSSVNSSFSLSRPEDKYRMSVTIGVGYDPQDISIKTRDDKLFINAKHEEKCESRTNYREFSKELTLPDDVNSALLSVIFNNGTLYIEAPYVD